MKASDLLAMLEHNDPTVFARIQKVKEQLKQLESFEKCQICANRLSYEYRKTEGRVGAQIVVERGTCQGCLAKVPTRAFAVH